MVIVGGSRKCKNTKVFIRVLPKLKNCWEDVKILDDKKRIYVRSLQDFGIGRDTFIPNYWDFETDGIFLNNSQLEVYETVTNDILNNVLEFGHNALIISYGQTGTGKSLTTTGLDASFEDRGILPRLLYDIFVKKYVHRDSLKMLVEISYIEAQRNYIVDLLNEDRIQLDMNAMKNISSIKITNEDEAMKYLFLGEARRTIVKDYSRSSHIGNSVCTITVTTKSKQTQSKKTISKIHIIDLAGADRSGFETCDFKNAFEVGTGNLAKTQLEQFILVLTENIPEKTLVFQRLNVLIHYLKDALNTESMLRFIGHIRTNREDLLVTLSMLRFSQIVRGLKPRKLKANLYENEDILVNKLQEDLTALKKEFDLNAMLNNESLRSNITQERVKQMENVAVDYLNNKTNELVVLNVSDASTVMKVFKNLYNKLEMEMSQQSKSNQAVVNKKSSYEDITNSSSKHLLRKDSSSSVNKGSRKQSIKSNSNSLDASVGKNGKKSNNSIRKLHRSFSKDKNSTETKLEGKEESSKTAKISSRNLRKSSSSKRKSSLISDQRKSESTLIGVSEIALPTDIPDYTEAWEKYVRANEEANTLMQQELQFYMQRTREINKEYIEQVKVLSELRTSLVTRKDELLQAQMQKDLIDNSSEKPETPLENKYKEIIKVTEVQLLAQQENVLKYQSELKMYVQQTNSMKNLITDKFELFCKEIYKTVVPEIVISQSNDELEPSCSNKVRRESPLARIQETEDSLKTEKYNTLMQYEIYQELRNKECHRKRNKELKNKKWLQSCKS